MSDLVIEPGNYCIEVVDGKIVLRQEQAKPASGWAALKDFSQRDPLWKDLRYSASGDGTFGKYGCFVTALASLATFAGYDVTPVTFAEAIGKAGAFDGNFLNHPSKITEAFLRLVWHKDPFIESRYASYVNWRVDPADLGVLARLLQKYPVILEVDFDEADYDIDQHFVLALEYKPDPAGGADDGLVIMDPWTGRRENILVDYFNPKWVRDGTMKAGATKVARTVTGLRVCEVVL